jgi:hypothetical protein
MEAEDLRPDEAGAAYGESRSCGADEELPKAALAMAAARARRRRARRRLGPEPDASFNFNCCAFLDLKCEL